MLCVSYFSPARIGVFLSIVLGGLIYFLVGTIIYKTCAKVPEGTPISFNAVKQKCEEGEDVFKKPYFMNLYGFFALCLSLLVYCVRECRQNRRLNSNPTLESSERERSSSHWKKLAIIGGPAICDAGAKLATYSSIALISSSAVLLIKGTRIIWTSLLSLLFFPKKKFFLYHWLAVGLASLGVILVGFSELSNKKSDKGTIWVGLVIALGGEAVRAFGLVGAEFLLKGKYKYDPLFITGCKGVWGIAFMVPVLVATGSFLHNSDGYPVEHISDSMFMISKSPTIISLLTSMFFLYFVADVGGLFIAKYLSAVHQSLCSVLRGLFVWALELGIFYVGFEEYGEKWSSYSILKLMGFGIVIIASLLYSGNFVLPCLYYPNRHENCEEKVVH